MLHRLAFVMFLLSSAIAGVRWQLRQSERANSERGSRELYDRCSCTRPQNRKNIKSHTFDVRTRGTGIHGLKGRATDARDCKGARRDDVKCAAGTDARVGNECLFQGAAASAAEPQNSIVKLEPSCMSLLHDV